MIKLSKSYLISVATILLILLAFAKAITLAIWWFLPSDGIELKVQDNYKPKYQRVDFKNMIVATKKTSIKESAKKADSSISITNMTLKGLYGTKNKGFAILALKNAPKKTSVVSVGEVFSGYKLEEILSDGVKFIKNSKEYILLMASIDSKKKSNSFITPVTIPLNEQAIAVTRNDIKDYAKSPDKIWNDIALSEVKNGSKIQGFKVDDVRKNSKIGKLGLKKGDVIIRVNNIEMTSYKDALNLYQEIDKINTIAIVVLRNNQEEELVYDID